jgi:hypothetical protein
MDSNGEKEEGGKKMAWKDGIIGEKVSIPFEKRIECIIPISGHPNVKRGP